jgi:DNA-binding response OmpR family regulator
LPDRAPHALQTGIEASKVIRAAGYQHLIIGVTGNSLEDELDEFIAAGADLVIVKPLKNQSLEMLLGFVQAHGFDSAHGYRIDQVGKEFTWVPRSPPEAYREN